jgi:hypothetical protein
MRATVMFGACDVRIENIPDACIIEPAENAAAAASYLLSCCLARCKCPLTPAESWSFEV